LLGDRCGLCQNVHRLRFCNLIDLYPTILKWAGIPRPDDHFLDGVSLAGLAAGRDGSLPDRDLYWHFPGYQLIGDTFRITPSGVILSWPWKLIEKFEDGSVELYNLDADPGETSELSSTQTAKVEELQTRLQKWRESTGSKLPAERNPAFQP